MSLSIPALALLLTVAAHAVEPPAPVNLATVCVRRPAGAAGWAVPLSVRKDGEALHSFGVGHQRCFSMPAGPHQLGVLYWARADRKRTRPAATLDLVLAPRDCRYVKIVMGFWGVLLAETTEKHFKYPAVCGA